MNDIKKYETIEKDIRKKIETSELKPNQVIPSEAELCRRYNVSRITVRRAIDDLVLSGLLYRIKGKGCFVREQVSSRLSHIYSFTEAVKNQGRIPSKKQLSLSFEVAGKTSDSLSIKETEQVYRIRSLYLADGQPYSVTLSTLPERVFPRLDYFNFNNRSLYEVLQSFYQIRISRVKQNLYAVHGTKEITELLKVDETHPLLKIIGISYCQIEQEEVPFELYETYILTEQMGYYVEKFSM